MKVLGVIPARGGSTRIPRKNTCLVGGRPLVQRAWEHAMSAMHEDYPKTRERALDDVIVSTDSFDIALRADRHGIGVFQRRCGPDGPMVDVLREVVLHYDEEGCEIVSLFDAVCCIQPTSPFRTGEDIRACVEMLRAHPESGSVVSIDESTGERNGAVYVTRVSMLRDGLVFDEHSLKYPMPHERSIDINTPEDLARAREMWAKLHT